MTSKAGRVLFYIVVLVFVVESLSWLGLKGIQIVAPASEIIPKTSYVYAQQTRKIEQLLKSQK